MLAVSFAVVGRLRLGVPAFGGNNQLAGGQKFLANLHGLLEEPAGIIAQVKNERFGASGFEFAERIAEVGGGGFAELQQADVTRLVLGERELTFAVDVADRIDLDLGAGQGVILKLAGGRAVGGNGDFRIGQTAQAFDGVGEAHLFGAFAVDLDDAIASQDAGSESRGVFHRGHYRQLIVLGGNHDAHSAEFTLSILLKILVFNGLHEFAVRVERAQHAFERPVDQVLITELIAVNVFLPDAVEDRGAEPEVGQGIVLLGGLHIIEVGDGAEDQIDSKRPKHHPKKNTTFHIRPKSLIFAHTRPAPNGWQGEAWQAGPDIRAGYASGTSNRLVVFGSVSAAPGEQATFPTATTVPFYRYFSNKGRSSFTVLAGQNLRSVMRAFLSAE